MNKRILAASIGLLFSGAVVADDCEHEKQLTLELDASATAELRIDAGSGSLTVLGNDGIDQIRATGRACLGCPADQAGWPQHVWPRGARTSTPERSSNAVVARLTEGAT